MSLPILRPLAFGEVLDGAFTLYRRRFVPFFCTALIPMLVMIAAFKLLGTGMFTMMLSENPDAFDAEAFGTGMLLLPVGLFTFLVMWGALARQASQAYLGQPTSVPDGFRAGLRAFLPLLGSAIVVFILGFFALIAVSFVVGIIAVLGASESEAAAVVMTMFAFLVGAVGYLAVFSLLFAVLPAVVVEHKGPVDALGRSFDLAKGAIGRIVGLMLVTLLITYLPGFAVMALTGGLANLMDPDHMPSAGQFMNQQMLGLAVNILTTPFMVAVMVLQYFDRRVRTEALDVQIAADGLAVAGS
jgi:hypothetical protein